MINMLLRSVDIWQVVVPFKADACCSPEFHEPRWDLDQIPKTVVRLNADGLNGIGETDRGQPVEAALGEAKRMAGRRIDEIVPGGPVAHAFEVALFDLIGKERDLPMWRLMGDKVRDRVKVHGWTAHRTPEDMGRKCREMRQMGFGGIKIKTQWGEPDIERLQAMRDACGPNFSMTIDPNSRYNTLANTLQLVKKMEPYNVLTLEDPFNKRDHAAYRLLRSKTDVPITLHLSSPDLIHLAAKDEACDYLNIGPSSPKDWLRCFPVAEAAGIPYWHGSEIALGIADMSFVHCCAIAPGCTLPSDIVHFVREDDLIEPGIRYEGGHAIVPDGPGLGVELDLAGIERYAIFHQEVTQ